METSLAVDYTTLDSKPEAQEKESAQPDTKAKKKEKPKKSQCSVNDKRMIKGMNEKVRELRKRHRDLGVAMGGAKTEEKIKSDEGESLVKEIQEVTGFFNSDEYNAMRPVYKRCQIKIPTLLDVPFWQPF
ncbi:MAG: hypothetical protein ACRBDL_07295 [Alphaproteobacteria bacterium]